MLEIQSLSVAYGPIQALSDVSLKIATGETVALLGANGAGKTTLLRTLSGLVAPSSGAMTLFGKALAGLSAEARVRAGLVHVPERRRIFPGLTVEENLLVAASSWAGLGGKVTADMDRLFELFPRLAERRRQEGWSLSGGEQQMLAIARGLMARPKVLMLDEPGLGLAPRIAAEVFARIRAIGRDGVTVLVVEQNAALALGVASRGYVLENGVVAAEGASVALRSDPRVREAYLGGA
jgi:branched-chain amino acid transport system ATP-binding protein